MDAHELLERLLADKPQLHYLSEDAEQDVKEFSFASAVGLNMRSGPASWACSTEVLRYLVNNVQEGFLTLETGAGYSTVIFAALAQHHICITPDKHGAELVQQYMDRVGIPAAKVTFILEPSDIALPKLQLSNKVDFAFVDGCHGYPFPALDWHYIDLQLETGGIIGFDNTELRSVRVHCEFLEFNQSYRLLDEIRDGNSGTNFYSKSRCEQREWIFQRYCAQEQERIFRQRRLITNCKRFIKHMLGRKI